MRPSEYNVRLNRIISAVPHRNLSQRDFDAACAGHLSAHINRDRTYSKLMVNYRQSQTKSAQARIRALRALAAPSR